jgi:hypothetical protein
MQPQTAITTPAQLRRDITVYNYETDKNRLGERCLERQWLFGPSASAPRIENLALSLLKLTAFIVATSVRVMESRPSWCGPKFP